MAFTYQRRPVLEMLPLQSGNFGCLLVDRLPGFDVDSGQSVAGLLSGQLESRVRIIYDVFIAIGVSAAPVIS